MQVIKILLFVIAAWQSDRNPENRDRRPYTTIIWCAATLPVRGTVRTGHELRHATKMHLQITKAKISLPSFIFSRVTISASTWQTYNIACAPSKDSDQPWHPPSLIRVFAVCMKKAWVLYYPLITQQRLIRLGGWMPRLIWVFTGRTCHFVGFVMRWLILQNVVCWMHAGYKFKQMTFWNFFLFSHENIFW